MTRGTWTCKTLGGCCGEISTIGSASEMLQNGSHVEGAVALLPVTHLAGSFPHFFLGCVFSFFSIFREPAAGRKRSRCNSWAHPSEDFSFFVCFLPGGTASTAGKKKNRKGDGSAATALFRPFSAGRMGNDSGQSVSFHFGRPATCGQVRGNEGRPQQSNQTGGTG
jgi:hypothetical protein